MEVIEYLLNKHGKECVIKDIVEYTGVLVDRESHHRLLDAFPPKVGPFITLQSVP